MAISKELCCYLTRGRREFQFSTQAVWIIVWYLTSKNIIILAESLLKKKKSIDRGKNEEIVNLQYPRLLRGKEKAFNVLWPNTLPYCCRKEYIICKNLSSASSQLATPSLSLNCHRLMWLASMMQENKTCVSCQSFTGDAPGPISMLFQYTFVRVSMSHSEPRVAVPNQTKILNQ